MSVSVNPQDYPELMAWPNCVTADCEHKACASLNSKYCGPCTKRLHAENSAPVGYFDALRAAQGMVRG